MNELIKLFIDWFQKRDRGNIVLFFLCVLVLSTILTLIWLQVFNHIPTEIRSVNQKIDKVEGKIDKLEVELKAEIRELRQDNKRIEGKIDKLLFYLIEEGKPKKPTNKKRINQ